MIVLLNFFGSYFDISQVYNTGIVSKVYMHVSDRGDHHQVLDVTNYEEHFSEENQQYPEMFEAVWNVNKS